MMGSRFSTACLGLSLFTWAAAVRADPIIYDNMASPNGGSGSSYYVPDFPDQPVNIQHADDFSLPASDFGWRVTDAHWTGGGHDQRFRLIFYADNGGEPTGGGGTQADPTPTAIAVREVTASVSPISNGAEYWADFAPVDLNGETTYWVSIQADSTIGESVPDELSWDWWGDDSGGNAKVGATAFYTETFWEDAGMEMVFALSGTEVPAPGAAVLAMLGLPAVGWVKRRLG